MSSSYLILCFKNYRASERSPFEGSCCGGGYANVDSVPASPDEDSENAEPTPPPRYRVVMLGDAGVGKTALVNQFMTSEYMHTYDASLGKLKRFCIATCIFLLF